MYITNWADHSNVVIFYSQKYNLQLEDSYRFIGPACHNNTVYQP